MSATHKNSFSLTFCINSFIWVPRELIDVIDLCLSQAIISIVNDAWRALELLRSFCEWASFKYLPLFTTKLVNLSVKLIILRGRLLLYHFDDLELVLQLAWPLSDSCFFCSSSFLLVAVDILPFAFSLLWRVSWDSAWHRNGAFFLHQNAFEFLIRHITRILLLFLLLRPSREKWGRTLMSLLFLSHVLLAINLNWVRISFYSGSLVVLWFLQEEAWQDRTCFGTLNSLQTSLIVRKVLDFIEIVSLNRDELGFSNPRARRRGLTPFIRQGLRKICKLWIR